MPANMKSAHIVVIDQSIDGYLSLLEAATAGGHEVILLSGKGDGFLELGQAIAGRTDIQSIHLFSHGSEGAIQLGQAQLNINNLNEYAGVLETIKFSLVEGGDLLIYGCNVAGSEEGKQFVAGLSEVLNADMAASDDLTGHRDLGGDWELEYQHGDISPVGDWLWSVRSEFMQTLGSTVALNSSWLMDNTDDWIYSDNQNGGDLSGTPDSIYIDIESQNPQLTYPVEFTIESISNTPFNLDSIAVRPFDTSNPYYLEILPDGDEGRKVTVPVIENQSNETVIISVDLNTITSFTVRFLDQGVTQGPPINLDFLNFSTSDAPVNNEPLFIDYGPFSIAENSANGSVVGDINANDGDGGADDANVTYSIVSGNPNLDLDGNSAFSIDINTGVITVNDTDDIDFEIATSHTLMISATDQNNAMTTQLVTINVTDDEGDNPPMLSTGDMAVLGWNALNDTITFTTLVDLPAGTVIKFTDKGWDQSTNAFTTSSTGDGVITWTVGSPINAGSVFELFMGGSDEVTTLINKTANVDLTADIVSSSFTVTDPMNLAGDSVFIYQGADSNPLFIFGMNNSGGTVDSSNWNTSIGATLRDSMLPNSTGSQNTLTNGTNAIGLPGGASQLDNVQYTGPTGIADKVTWLARISDAANWTGDNTGAISTSAGSSVQIGVPNEAPVLATSSKASVAENSTAVATLVATDADGDALTYSITGGADQALFNIDTKSGALTFFSAPDFEAPADSNGDNAYNVEVTASDGQGGTTPLTLTVTVTDVNEAPTLVGATKVDVAENTAGTIYTALASDPENDTLFYTLSGTDATLFNLDANSGALSFKNAPDFEAPADAGGNNVYDVILTANDGSLSSSPQALAITVTNTNEVPVFVTSSKASVAENSIAVTTLVATDVDGDTLTYSITGGADQALFNLDTKSGALTFISAPDFEAPADSNGDNAYNVEVTASDGQGGTTPLTLMVTVTDVNEAPILVGASKVDVAENTTGTIYTALASDPENDTLFYTLSGTDAALFDLNANSGALSFKSAPDFEAPADADGNNIYDVILTANDGSLNSVPQALSITVTDVVDGNNAPVFTTSSKASVAENTTAVTTLLATDADGDTLTYSIIGGADQTLFSLDSKSGTLTFIGAPDYEAPIDSNNDNDYSVTVAANDGHGGSSPLSLTVTVTDINEEPTLNGSTKESVTVSENAAGTVFTATGSDPENDPLIYTLSGTDAALFNLDANSGALSFKNAPDFEAPADAGGNNVYDVILTASDGSLSSAPQALAITVTDVDDGNEAPVFTTSSKASVAENTTAVTTLVATDADGDVLTYSLTGGADQALFTLDANSGALSFKSAPNFEAPADSNSDNTYTVEVTASDGQGGSAPLTLEVTVADVNEAPTLLGATKVSVAENTTGTLYTATASDPENDPLIYTMSGADAALFTLDTNSGALSFKSAPDFEAPADAGGNNVYDVILMASDGSLSSAPQTLAITVTDINEAPVFTTANKVNVAENTTAVTTLVATDADGDVLTYSLTGGADQALFTLDANSGALSFKSAPDFEAPADSNSDNTYTVEVTASDGQGGSVPLTLEVTVTDVNETPPIIPPEEPQPPTLPVPGSIAVTPGAAQPNTPSGNISISEIITNNGTSSGSVRLVENTGNANIVTATLPGRVSLQHDGSRTATDQDSAMADLIASIVGKSPANMPEQTNVASQWLSSLAEGALLDIRTLTFSAIEPIATPIVLTGNASNNSLSSHLEAFVIDTSALPIGTSLQLDNIEFASIVGNAVITGGSGNNNVIGDDAAQYIVLGEGDDVLYGGGGDDVIGSEGGDDRLFGGNGNDELFGGAGADLLHGGSDADVASYQGNREEYVVTQLHSVITVSRRDDPSDVDTLINIETLRFTDDEENISYANDLGWITGLYAQVLGRQGDVEGVQYWAQRHEEGMSKSEMALLFINSVEAGEQLTTQDQSMEAILDILYQSLLDREADAEGKAYWANQIENGVSLRDLAEGFMTSDEMRTHDLAHTQWDFIA